jgi:hypothetical protein
MLSGSASQAARFVVGGFTSERELRLKKEPSISASAGYALPAEVEVVASVLSGHWSQGDDYHGRSQALWVLRIPGKKSTFAAEKSVFAENSLAVRLTR